MRLREHLSREREIYRPARFGQGNGQRPIHHRLQLRKMPEFVILFDKFSYQACLIKGFLSPVVVQIP